LLSSGNYQPRRVAVSLFSLSLRDVELILAERGVVVTHECIRHWRQKFGAEFAKRLRRRRPRLEDTRHLDEVFIRIRGVLHYLGRAVDQHGVVLDILVQAKRDGAAAKANSSSTSRRLRLDTARPRG
jgi:putative transposase